jgi:hypothetical protein
MAIKQFVEDQSLTFKQGRGFYQLTKKELVQHHKVRLLSIIVVNGWKSFPQEVIVYRRSTGDFWCGANARKVNFKYDNWFACFLTPSHVQMLGLGSSNADVYPPKDADLIFFVQSTSYNRKLIGGTKFLYEVDLEA